MNTETKVADIFINNGFVEDGFVVEDPLAIPLYNDTDLDNAFYEGYYEGHNAADSDYGVGNILVKLLVLLFCICVLATGVYMSRMYSKNKREEQLEEIRRLREARAEAIEAIVEKSKEEETKRNEITEVIEGFAISMTSIGDRTIPNGNVNEEDEGNNKGVYPTKKKTISIVQVLDDEEEKMEVDIEEPVVDENNNVLSSSIHDQHAIQHQQQQKIPASKLLEAALNNPCAICLDVFETDDNIIFCSNEYSPHCFHQECSLDYLVSHNEGVQAPCPLCRKPFMCSCTEDE